MDTMVDALSLLARAKKAASESGATLIGDKQSRRFSHAMLKGEYHVVGQTVIVTITGEALVSPMAPLRVPFEGACPLVPLHRKSAVRMCEALPESDRLASSSS
jgi:hypothetical protein